MTDQAPINPYAPPALVAEQTLSPDAPQYRLFTVTAIVVGTFLGGLAGGGVLMLCNFVRLGQPAVGWALAAGCTAGMLALMTASMFLPEDVPSLPFLILQMGIAYGLAKWLQGPLIEQHQNRGGRLASMWWAAGASILAGVLVFAVFLASVVFLPESWFFAEESSLDTPPWPE